MGICFYMGAVIWPDMGPDEFIYIALATGVPLGLSLMGLAITALVHWRRMPVVHVVVNEMMSSAFLAQEQRYVRREQLKQQLHDVSAEIETFNANMDPDTRTAWSKRPGPYGK